MTPQDIRDHILGKYSDDGVPIIPATWLRDDYVKHVARNATDAQLQEAADLINAVLNHVTTIGMHATACALVDVPYS